MTNRELDRAVALALGYRYDGSAWWTHPGGARTSVDGLPRFSSDIAAAFEFEEEIARRGRQGRYVRMLGGFIKDATLFDLIHASPEMRCQAALQTLEDYTV